MFLQYYHQPKSHNPTAPILPLQIAPKNLRQITTSKSSWPIAEPFSPTTKFARMGCGPSRPTRSFYNEYFVEQPRKQRSNEGNGSPMPKVEPPPRALLKERRLVSVVEDEAAEEGARGDLKIYQEEIEARRREEEQRIFVRHVNVRQGEVFF